MSETPNPPSRRRWLESAALLTMGTALTAKSLSKVRWPEALLTEAEFTVAPPTPVEKLVSETPLPRLNPAAIGPPTYEDFLSRFRLRHIRPHEVINPHLRTLNGVENTLPPTKLWQHMPASLFVADEIRARLGKPLNLITSAYRNPAYNKVCGGASQSWHTKNSALDLVYEGGPKEAYAIAAELRKEGYFKGGIGLYKSFIHIDTRGRNATWRG